MGVYYDHEAYLTILPGHENAVRLRATFTEGE